MPRSFVFFLFAVFASYGFFPAVSVFSACVSVLAGSAVYFVAASHALLVLV
jgi:hypothetical protein